MPRPADQSLYGNPLARYQEFAPAVAEITGLLEYMMQKAEEERKKKVDGLYPYRGYGYPLQEDYSYYEYYGGARYGDDAFRQEKNALDWSIEQLTERLQAACVSTPIPSSLMKGKTLLVPGSDLFRHLSYILGFFNFLPAPIVSTQEATWKKEQIEGFVGEPLSIFGINVFRRLNEVAELSGEELEKLSEAAAKRVVYRLRTQHNRLPSDYDAVGRYFFYQKAYSFKEVSDTSPLVAQIISGERERLRKFVAALRGTLHVLSAVAALRKDKPAPENMIEFLRTLQSVLTGTTGVEELR